MNPNRKLNEYDPLLQTVRIVCKYTDNSSGVGTGFQHTFLPKFDNNKLVDGIQCIVTNKHLIKECENGFFLINLLDKKENRIINTEKIIFKNEDWIDHPVGLDLSVLPINSQLTELVKSGKAPFFANLTSLYLDEKEWNKIKSIENVIMIGFPNGLWDEKNNSPIVRNGNTATPAISNYQGNEEFLVNIPIFPGTSGSPIYVYDFGIEFNETGGWSTGNRCYFIGILYAGLEYEKNHFGAKKIMISTKTDESDLMSNLGVAIKSTKLNDFEKVINTS